MTTNTPIPFAADPSRGHVFPDGVLTELGTNEVLTIEEADGRWVNAIGSFPIDPAKLLPQGTLTFTPTRTEA